MSRSVWHISANLSSALRSMIFINHRYGAVHLAVGCVEMHTVTCPFKPPIAVGCHHDAVFAAWLVGNAARKQCLSLAFVGRTRHQCHQRYRHGECDDVKLKRTDECKQYHLLVDLLSGQVYCPLPRVRLPNATA